MTSSMVPVVTTCPRARTVNCFSVLFSINLSCVNVNVDRTGVFKEDVLIGVARQRIAVNLVVGVVLPHAPTQHNSVLHGGQLIFHLHTKAMRCDLQLPIRRVVVDVLNELLRASFLQFGAFHEIILPQMVANVHLYFHFFHFFSQVVGKEPLRGQNNPEAPIRAQKSRRKRFRSSCGFKWWRRRESNPRVSLSRHCILRAYSHPDLSQICDLSG